jgi:hypothetical protein
MLDHTQVPLILIDKHLFPRMILLQSRLNSLPRLNFLHHSRCTQHPKRLLKTRRLSLPADLSYLLLVVHTLLWTMSQFLRHNHSPPRITPYWTFPRSFITPFSTTSTLLIAFALASQTPTFTKSTDDCMGQFLCQAVTRALMTWNGPGEEPALLSIGMNEMPRQRTQ